MIFSIKIELPYAVMKARHDVLILEEVLDGVGVVEVEGGERQSLLKQEVPKIKTFQTLSRCSSFEVS